MAANRILQVVPPGVADSVRRGPAEATSSLPVGPGLFVILGASGDLTERKLIPALYNLAANGLLPETFALLGMASSDLDSEAFRERIHKQITEQLGPSFDARLWEALAPRLYYMPGDLRDPAAYARLRDLSDRIASDHQTGGNVLFYLAIPPALFGEVVRHLGEAGLTEEREGRWRRVVVEKPFGRDLESARALSREIGQVLRERQIYRIDHYLGKETVQNILVLRFANGIFEPVWNRRYIDHVQLTVAEELGVEHRGRYYDTAGALRDMVPNHLFSLLSLLAMEPPSSFDADAVRNEKGKVLTAIQPMRPEEVLRRTVRGQYGPGRLPDSTAVPGYREEPYVAPESNTETFVAMKFLIDNWRWADVPFYLRTGKRLPVRRTEISIVFKRVPLSVFHNTPVDRLTPNALLIEIQPEERISLHFGAKIPGAEVKIAGVEMDFCYGDTFGTSPATGYETLLYDAMTGDATLFQRGDNVERAWTIVAPILDVWNALPPRDFPNYRAGTWGPEDAAQLLGREGRAWRTIA